MMNANNPMTPGVYTVEKNGFPNSVAEVPTAIPAFIGYTEQALKNGKPITEPTLVNSLKEYEEYFGGAPVFQYPIKPETPSNPREFTVNGVGYFVGQPAAGNNFYMYHCLQWFYQNGGGPCYIVSIGSYYDEAIKANTQPDKDDFLSGLALLPKVPFPKPTMILMPDALLLGESADYFTVQQQALLQCGEQQDRVALIDIYNGDQSNEDAGVIDDFRNQIGNTYLKYGITYYPFLKTTIVGSSDVTYANVDQTSPGATKLATMFPASVKLLTPLQTVSADCKSLENLIATPHMNLAAAMPKTIAKGGEGTAYPTWTAAYNSAPMGSTPVEVLKYKAGTIYWMALTLTSLGQGQLNDPDIPITTSDLKSGIAKLMYSNGYLAGLLWKLSVYDTNYLGGSGSKTPWNIITTDVLKNVGFDATDGTTVGLTTAPPNLPGDPYTSAAKAFTFANKALDGAFKAFNTALEQVPVIGQTLLDQYNSSMESGSAQYKNVMQAIADKAGILPPCSAMAGMYTLVDNTRGVWQSPANRNIFSATGPTVSIDDDSQASLNVDALAGKSVNAIRSFYGRGPAMVWGARTLDGNSQDWRYINVRRTMIMMEQSVANAAFALVFESNNDATWTICTAMISNFLHNLWSQGALQGASPADAYSVEVGLGKTMTPEDILNGIMRVQVKVAVVRPAEFIIITYEQQMAKS